MTKRATVGFACCILLVASLGAAFASGSKDTATSTGPTTIRALLRASDYVLTVTDWATNPYGAYINKLTGYNLQWEFLPWNEWDQRLTVRFASGDLPDLVGTRMIDSLVHPGAVDQGVFAELGPYLDQYGPDIKKNIPPALWKSPHQSKNGKIYGIPTMSPYASNEVVYIRSDWLAKAGMQPPKTLDDWLKFYQWVKVSDPNGNGVADEYGFFGRENGVRDTLFFRAHGTFPSTWKFTGGQLVPEMILPQMKDAIRFWKTLYENGYVNPNFLTNKFGDWQAGIYNSKGASWLHDFSNYDVDWLNKMVDKSARLSMIPSPVGPTGEKGLQPAGDRHYFTVVIPAKSKVIADVVKFINMSWANPELQKFFRWGIKDRNYTEQGGKILFDEQDPAGINLKDWEMDTFRVYMNMTVYQYDTPEILAQRPNAQIYIDGSKTAAADAFPNVALYLPVPEVFKTAPELQPGFVVGSLFLDLFAKVVTGRADLDSSFDTFVAEWKKRGGDEAIKFATDWYNSTSH